MTVKDGILNHKNGNGQLICITELKISHPYDRMVHKIVGVMNMSQLEKVYRTMRNTGAGSIAIGIIILVTGVSVGILSIVNGAMLLKHRSRVFDTLLRG